SRRCSRRLLQCEELPPGPARPAHRLARELAVILQQQVLFSLSFPMRRTSAGTSAGAVLAVFHNAKNFHWDLPPRRHPAAAGAVFAVFHNAKNFRRDLYVPLIVSLVNTGHLAIVLLVNMGHLAIIPQQQALFSLSSPITSAGTRKSRSLSHIGHLAIIPQQQVLFSPPLKSGFIVSNTNCSTTGYVIPLAAMERVFGPLEAVMVTTMQACRP
ncbi:LOW QUALITY PROTEIN: hypothetical protein CVT25_010510, partial [Psilocybe cyanescens]